MNITVVGTGYVGLVTGVGLADRGHYVTCVDIDQQKIDNLNNGISPIYESGLDELIAKNVQENKLFFTTNLAEAMNESSVIFIGVGTPQGEDGSANLSYVYKVAEDIGKNLKHYSIIINKSTVPVGTAKRVAEIISSFYTGEFDVVSNPEFLREGLAISDFMFPDRIVIGTDSEKAKAIIEEVYADFDCPKIYTNPESSELIKYASNAFLATKISFINEISGICEMVGADVKDVARGMGLDHRIGEKFLEAGLGYGGSCFPKDTRALHHIANTNGYDFRILKSVIEVNNNQRKVLIEKIKRIFPDLRGKKIAIWGLAFKPDTDDVRESPAIDLIQWLHGQGARVSAYDPVATNNAKKYLPDTINFYDCPYETAQDNSAVIIVTDWKHFKEIDKNKLKSVMAENYIIDGRNIFDPKEMKELGFIYEGIGRRNY